MNKWVVLHYLSKAMLIGSVLFAVPALVSLCFEEYRCAFSFLSVGVGVALVFAPLAMIRRKQKGRIYTRESMAIAALLWVVFSLVSALPFYFSGVAAHLWDAIFESVSGFTTTGASIFSDVEHLPKGILFWRCFSQWIGGMGVLVLAIAILPSSNDAMYLMRAECAGPSVSKIVPKGKNSAAYLYLIYAGMTIVTLALLCVGGMPLFDSVCHALSIAGTGGFSVKNAGLAAYGSGYFEGVATVMMILFGVNFSMIYFLLARRWKEIRRNTELKVYFGVLALAALTVTWNIYPYYQNIWKSLGTAIFQTVSIMTSTGLAAADFNLWPLFSQIVLLFLMFVGGCAGSTSGGFKVQRLVILWKSGIVSFKKMVYPNSVNLVKSNDKTLSAESVHGVMRYLVVYLCIFVAAVLLVSLDNADFGTTITAVFSCLNNIGPGINEVGPMDNYVFFSDFSKVVLSLVMLLGRLECLPLLMLMLPSVWRRDF